MKKSGSTLLYATCIAMLIMIIDNHSVFQGASQGVQLCLQTVIPALFPMMVISVYITGGIYALPVKFLKPIARLCRIPQGCEALLAVGFLGGYPSGAQSIAIAQQEGHLSLRDSRRMLAFCNNAGPSFLFGMVGPMFSRWYIPWILWSIHIVSALIVGTILPGSETGVIRRSNSAAITFPKAVRKTMEAICMVCAWVILFRIVIIFSEKWFLRFLPVGFRVWISGMLELTNGCIQLVSCKNEGFRFVTASVLLAFGGICVCLQTKSVAPNIPMDLYLQGKTMQSIVSFLLAYLLQKFIYADSWSIPSVIWLIPGILMLLFFIVLKNRGSIPRRIVV